MPKVISKILQQWPQQMSLAQQLCRAVGYCYLQHRSAEICASATREIPLGQNLHSGPTFNRGWNLYPKAHQCSSNHLTSCKELCLTLQKYSSLHITLVGVGYKIQKCRSGRGGCLKIFLRTFFPLSKWVCTQLHTLLSSRQNEKYLMEIL